MGGRAVQCTGLENRQTFTGLVGSNPTPSARYLDLTSFKTAIRHHPGKSRQPVVQHFLSVNIAPAVRGGTAHSRVKNFPGSFDDLVVRHVPLLFGVTKQKATGISRGLQERAGEVRRPAR